MKVIKTFKYLSNLEYVHSILEEDKIPYSIDWENLNISSDKLEESKILKIIDDLNLDENEVAVDENFQKDFDDWHKNSLNPGHFMGGRIPFFFWNKKNYPFLLFTIFFAPIVSIITMSFADGDWNFDLDLYSFAISLFYLFVGISMFVQWLNYKKNSK